MPFRQLVQPGPPAPVRVLSAVGNRAREVRMVLPAGATLLDALRDALGCQRVRSASLALAYGRFSTFHYHVPVEGPRGGKVVVYGPALLLRPPVALLAAGAIFGHDGDRPILHCHGAVVDADGRTHGGHLAVERCVIGEGGMVVFASCLENAGFATDFDAETTFRLLRPYGGMGVAA